jgi:hypothetical protein
MKLDVPSSYFCINEATDTLYLIGISPALDLEIRECPLHEVDNLSVLN